MAIVSRKPRNASLRFQTFVDTSHLSKEKPLKSLTIGLSKSGGRNAYGRITVRHRGGGAAKKYRVIDFNRSVRDIEGTITAFEYDPNRNARISLVHYKDGEKAYILHPNGLGRNSSILSASTAPIQIGNALPLENIPLGTEVHNVELKPGQGGQIARSAGSFVQILAKDGNWVTLRLPSGEVRMVSKKCWATIGQVSGSYRSSIILGKAGRKRWLGRRPRVRGVAKNPVDHPHGGGEGRAPIGRPHPVTPWGRPALGERTRKPNRPSDPLIIRRRKT